jgi:hypothetical protein
MPIGITVTVVATTLLYVAAADFGKRLFYRYWP